MFDYNAKALQQTITSTLGPVAFEREVTYKNMFGGVMSYTYGRPFASLSNAGIALKLNKDGIDDLIKAGGYPLRYKPSDPPSKSYTIIPKPLTMAGGSDLEFWLLKSMDHAKTLPLPKKRKPTGK